MNLVGECQLLRLPVQGLEARVVPLLGSPIHDAVAGRAEQPAQQEQQIGVRLSSGRGQAAAQAFSDVGSRGEVTYTEGVIPVSGQRQAEVVCQNTSQPWVRPREVGALRIDSQERQRYAVVNVFERRQIHVREGRTERSTEDLLHFVERRALAHGANDLGVSPGQTPPRDRHSLQEQRVVSGVVPGIFELVALKEVGWVQPGSGLGQCQMRLGSHRGSQKTGNIVQRSHSAKAVTAAVVSGTGVTCASRLPADEQTPT